MRRVLVTGGRDFKDRDMAFAALDALHALDPIDLIIEGGNRTRDDAGAIVGGADYWAKAWAEHRGITVHTERADWKTHGPQAGPMRNQAMIEMKPDLVLALPGGRGTADMVRRANAWQIPVATATELAR